MRDPKGEDRSEDVNCPARPSAQELRELVSTRAAQVFVYVLFLFFNSQVQTTRILLRTLSPRHVGASCARWPGAALGLAVGLALRLPPRAPQPEVLPMAQAWAVCPPLCPRASLRCAACGALAWRLSARSGRPCGLCGVHVAPCGCLCLAV